MKTWRSSMTVRAACVALAALALPASGRAQGLHGEDAPTWCNVAGGGTLSATSELGKLSAGFLVDGKQGRQSDGTYWNDGTRGEAPDSVTIQFDQPTKVREIRLVPPAMDLSGPFAIRHVGVEVKTDRGWKDINTDLTLIAERQTRPKHETVATVQSEQPVTAVRVTFHDATGNGEGWNFLGEIEVIGWGTPTPPAHQETTTMEPHIPDSVEAAAAWLHVKAFEMIRAARREMHDGTAAFPPQVGAGYGAFWLRDYAYMLEGCIDAFTFEELRDAWSLFVNAQRADGAMVDTIKFDGTPIYKPGFGRMGKNPVADGSQFAVDVAWHSYRRTGDRVLLTRTVEGLARGMRAVPRSADSGLVHIRPQGWDRCPYGFTDSVRKQGDVLFCSLLYVQACNQIADLFQALDRTTEAAEWRSQARSVNTAVRETFWDEETGLFRAATVKCREHDIWGSAFAVFIGVATAEQSHAVASYFRDHYREIVKRGQIRHTPGGVWWEQACGREVYQNGAYWATPVGWFVYTLDLVSPDLADRTVIDLVRDFIELDDVNECVNDGYANVKAYIASAALPLDGIRRMLERRKTR
jgi:hypothetical protein